MEEAGSNEAAAKNNRRGEKKKRWDKGGKEGRTRDKWEMAK